MVSVFLFDVGQGPEYCHLLTISLHDATIRTGHMQPAGQRLRENRLLVHSCCKWNDILYSANQRTHAECRPGSVWMTAAASVW